MVTCWCFTKERDVGCRWNQPQAWQNAVSSKCQSTYSHRVWNYIFASPLLFQYKNSRRVFFPLFHFKGHYNTLKWPGHTREETRRLTTFKPSSFNLYRGTRSHAIKPTTNRKAIWPTKTFRSLFVAPQIPKHSDAYFKPIQAEYLPAYKRYTQCLLPPQTPPPSRRHHRQSVSTMRNTQL